jgi:3-oxoacyl-[acyl-carrier protein] reductase
MQPSPTNKITGSGKEHIKMATTRKIALVTGSSRGIGRTTALQLAESGFLVAVHYGNNAEAADGVVAEIEAKGGQAFAVGANLETTGGVRQLFEALDNELERRTGQNRFDVLVNNAAIAFAIPFEQTTEEIFDQMMQVNVKAPFFVVQEALPRLNDGGRIINLSSVVTRVAFPVYTAYGLTKAAIDNLTLMLAAQLGERGITVNAVSPGATDTDMAAWVRSPEGEQQVLTMNAIKRVGQPKDIAAVINFLASDAAGWVTGQTIEASGGARL